MQPSLIQKLCCPFDKKDLRVEVFVRDTNDNIVEGMLTCTHCRRYYPVVYGIPVMTPDEYRQPELEAPILRRWKGQLSGTKTENFHLLPEEGGEGGPDVLSGEEKG